MPEKNIKRGCYLKVTLVDRELKEEQHVHSLVFWNFLVQKARCTVGNSEETWNK